MSNAREIQGADFSLPSSEYFLGKLANLVELAF
jgi:hypothetical protein